MWTSSIKESKLPTHSGLFGGYSETVVPGIRVVDTDVLEKLASGDPDLPRDDLELVSSTKLGGKLILEHQTRSAIITHRGELFCASTQGGGGYGDVLEREPGSVVGDLRTGIITPWVAEHIYQVAYNPETLALDLEETERRRQAEREARKAQEEVVGRVPRGVERAVPTRGGPEVLRDLAGRPEEPGSDPDLR